MNNYNFSQNIMQSINEVKNIINEHQKTTNNKIVIYSAMTNSYDELPLQYIKDKNIDFIFFTDSDIESDFWNIIKFDFEYREPRRTAKIFKILPHLFFEHYDMSLWVDSNLLLKENIIEIINDFKQQKINFIALEHNRRICAYQEANECIKWGKDNTNTIVNQMKSYEDKNYPKNNGLHNCRFLLRKHNELDIKNAMNFWWNEIEQGSVRDQLSFNYTMWKTQTKFDYILNKNRSLYFDVIEHAKDINYGVKQNVFKEFIQKIIRILVSIKRKVRFE